VPEVAAASAPAPGSGVLGLAARRRLTGLALATLGLPLLTLALVALRDSLSLGSVLLLYLLLVVGIAVVGGVVASFVAAIASVLLVNWYFIPPLHTLQIDSRDNVVALVVFVGVAAVVSTATELAARSRAALARSEAEADVLARFAAEPVDEADPVAVLTQVRRTFGLDSVALVSIGRDGEHVLARSGPVASGAPTLDVEAGGADARLRAWGRPLFAEDRSLLDRLATAAARAAEARELADTAERLAEVDRLRSALLAAVGHDLRTPLAGIKAAVGGLRDPSVDWSDEERAELLATVDESADRLDVLLSNLLDLSRLQAGALSVRLEPVHVEEVLARAVLGAGEVSLEVPDGLAPVCADAGLLERVVANLVANAVRHAPTGSAVEVRATPVDGLVRVEVVDHGPGVPTERWDEMFQPFQRLDDRTPGGVGVGLAVARGFTEAMGATIRPATTPGGGLSMALDLPLAAEVDG
jgi:K+-sensing histidine kinase KdpD